MFSYQNCPIVTLTIFTEKVSPHEAKLYTKRAEKWPHESHWKYAWKSIPVTIFFDLSRSKIPCLFYNHMWNYILLDDFSCSFCMELWKFCLLCSCRKKYTSLFVPTCYVSFGRKLADFEYVKCFHLSISSIFILFHPHHLLFSCHFLEKYWQNDSFRSSLSNLHSICSNYNNFWVLYAEKKSQFFCIFDAVCNSDYLKSSNHGQAIIKSLMRGLKKGSIRFAYFYDVSFSSKKIWLKSTVVRDFGSPGMVPLWTEWGFGSPLSLEWSAAASA